MTYLDKWQTHKTVRAASFFYSVLYAELVLPSLELAQSMVQPSSVGTKEF